MIKVKAHKSDKNPGLTVTLGYKEAKLLYGLIGTFSLVDIVNRLEPLGDKAAIAAAKGDAGYKFYNTISRATKGKRGWE